MRYLTVEEVIAIHGRVLAQSGGSEGIRDHGGLHSAVGQPSQTFGGEDLYPTVIEKAAALGFFLCSNHAFIDGNKRIGHAAMEVMLALAAGEVSREEFTEWVASHAIRR